MTAIKPVSASQALQFLDTLERYARQLSSIEERSDALKTRKEVIRGKVFDALSNVLRLLKKDRIETIYGSFTFREPLIYDFSSLPEGKKIARAQNKVNRIKLALKEAEAVLSFMEKEAIKTHKSIPHSNGPKVLVFNRNKSVSARAKKGRIYVRTYFSLKNNSRIPISGPK